MDQPRIAAVVLDSGLDKLLDYSIPPELEGRVHPGMRVQVPVRNSLRSGTVHSLKSSSEFRLQPIASLSSEKPLVSEELFALAVWISKYWACPLGKAIRLVLPPPVRSGMEEKRQLFVKPLLSRPDLAALCAKKPEAPQSKLIEVLLQSPKGVLLSELLEKSGVSRSPLSSLAKAGVISLEQLEIDRCPIADQEFFPTKPKPLGAEQQQAFDKIVRTIQEERFETHLLFGITGSGKTEVYLQAIDRTLSMGKGALFLVPEIALTGQTVERMRSRFEKRIAILHHRLSHGERRDAWHKILSGEIRLVVGPRSALFSPVPRLGLIIVDEEHEPSYKQADEMPCYHARDAAVMRGKIAKAAVVLGSATPSLESFYNASTGKYTLSRLSVRPDLATRAEVTIVDMKKEFEKAKGFTLFSDKLLTEVEKRIKIGEQSLLFLNRRGFHTAQVCKACAHAIECPRCAVALTFHKGEARLACHLCNYEISPPPRSCPKCGSSEELKFRGAGTEQVEKALHAIFPEVRTLRLDGDTTRHKGSHEKLFKQFRAGKADILIGTQMIAKGLHFPSVTLVGVLHADASLQIPDFRSGEHTFQILTQVAGRSGRGALPGVVLIQTHLPGNSTIQYAAKQDYDAFYRDEIEVRRLFNYPPFTRLVKVVAAGPSEEETLAFTQKIRSLAVSALSSDYEIHPAAACGHAKIKDHFRFQFLIKGKTIPKLPEFPSHKNIKFFVDIDPISTYF